MKSSWSVRIFLLPAIVAASSAVIGCGDSKSAPKTGAANAATSKTVQIDVLSVAKKLDSSAFANVDFIDQAFSPNPATPVVIKGPTIKIAGFAVDQARGEAAAGVVVVVGDHVFPATFGAERPDIAKALNNPKYLHSMYVAEVPTSSVPKGRHAVKLRVVAADLSGYYESDVKATIEVL